MMITDIQNFDERNRVIEADGNSLVLASAGTGKTHLIVEKLNQLSKNNCPKKFAAITYTDKAANELENRLEKRNVGDRVVSQTMHKWIMKEIIKPFVSNCYNVSDKNQIKYSFKKKIASFEEGLQYVETTGQVRSYTDSKRDFAFQLALKILKDSYSAQRYLKATYSWIFVDEYQDVNGDQHALIQFIVGQLKIKAFLVGDNKQEIFRFRGSNTAYLESFKDDESFTTFELTHNFRSNQEIVAYSRLFDDNYKYSSGYNHFSEEAVVNVNPKYISIKEIVNNIKTETPEDSILILKTQNSSIDELKNSDEIFDNFQTRIFLMYSESEFSDIFSLLIRIFFRVEGIYALKKYINASLLHENFSHINSLIVNFNDSGNVEVVRQLLQLVSTLSENKFSNNDEEIFLKAVKDDNQIKSVLGIDAQYKILTIHGAKGLEADHVIIDPSEFLYHGRINRQTHYVAITRAKKKLWLMNDDPTYKNIVESLVQKDSTLPSKT